MSQPPRRSHREQYLRDQRARAHREVIEELDMTDRAADGMMTTDAEVCGKCGVAIGHTASGKAVHLDEVPKGVGYHDAEPKAASEWLRESDERQDIRRSAHDMLAHHASLCPATECAWARNLREALRSGT